MARRVIGANSLTCSVLPSSVKQDCLVTTVQVATGALTPRCGLEGGGGGCL